MKTADFFAQYTEAYEVIMARTGYSLYGALCDLHLSALAGRKKILESGCGPGNFAMELLEKSKVWAVDQNSVALDRLKTKAGDNKDLEIACHELHSLPYEDEFFDGISSMLVLPFMDDPIKYLREHKRVLKSGGVFVISGPGPGARDKVGWMEEQWQKDLVDKGRWEKLSEKWLTLKEYTVQNVKENVKNWYETDELLKILEEEVGLKIIKSVPNPIYFGMGYVVIVQKD